MRDYIMIAIIFFGVLLNIQAQKYDHQWVFGYGASEEFKFGISLLDFNNGVLEVSFLRESENYELGFSGSFTNNPNDGTLELNTNNCFIKDSNWNNVNTSGYIQGDVYKSYCDDGYFPVYQGAILLPDLVNSDLTHIVFKDVEIDFDNEDIFAPNVYHGTILNNDDDSLVYLGSDKLNNQNFSPEDITATPNATKNAWWVLQAKNQTNEIVKHLISQDTVIMSSQSIGVIFNALEQSIGQTSFSPDGNMIAYNSRIGIHLYDFNNETGLLSNYRKIEYPNQENVAKGLCFSPNSRFIYVNNAEEIYQIDLDLMDEPYFIKYFRTVDGDGWPVDIGMMFLGPDCRIYMSPGSTTYYLHVIHQPNEKGEASMFQSRAIELPANVPHHLPNIPNYRYLNGCDPSIEFPFPAVSVEDSDEILQNIYAYPNPVADLLHISLASDIANVKLILVDQLGRNILQFAVNQNDNIIDVSNLESGIYYLKENSGSGRTIQKVIKI